MAIAVIIVSYKTPDDIADCLRALDQLEGGVEFGVFIVENGGPEAFEFVSQATADLCGAVADEPDRMVGETRRASRHLRCRMFKLPFSRASVFIAEANDNLGYAGGVNSWLERLVGDRRWDGFWILNPDTAPEPMALATLVAACRQPGKGMAGSVILDYGKRDRIASRGLQWKRWRVSARSVDHGCLLSSATPEQRVEIDAPCGTSIYVTRTCLEQIGFMNEEYFLYFEDMEWGVRAKAAGLLCSADDSFIPHKYGSTLGSAERRADRSKLSVYLDARNTILFTKIYDARFMPWAVLRSVLKIFEFCAVGSLKNSSAALSGLVAGVRGETGRPYWHK